MPPIELRKHMTTNDLIMILSASIRTRGLLLSEHVVCPFCVHPYINARTYSQLLIIIHPGTRSAIVDVEAPLLQCCVLFPA